MSRTSPPLAKDRAAAWARSCAGAALFGLGLGGCGIGTAAIVSSSGGGSTSNAPPVVSDVLVGADPNGVDAKESPVSFSFKVTDAESNPVDIDVLFVPPSGTPIPLQLTGSPTNLDQLHTSPAGVSHTRYWDFASQLGVGLHAGYQVLVRTRIPGSTAESGTFAVGNDAPVVSYVAVPLPPLEAAGLVPISFMLSDSSSDLVSVSVDYQVAGDPIWHPATSAGNPLENISTTSLPEIQFFIWDTDADLTGLERDVQLRFTPSDGFPPPSAAVITGVFHVDNNAAPSMQLQEGAFLADPDSVRGIRVPYTVIDQESDETTVVFQWRREDDADFFETHPLQGTPAEIEALLANPSFRREHHVCTPYPRTFEGRAIRIDSTQVRLPELSGELSFLAQTEASGALLHPLVGRELEILRPSTSLSPVTGPWHPNLLVHPVAALPLGSGTNALVLDENSSGNWRLVELRLLDGVIESTIASGSGTPGALCFEAGEASVVVASALGNAWLVDRIGLADGLKTHLADYTDGTVEQGVPRGIASLGTNAAVLTVGSSLVRVDWDLASIPPERRAVALLTNLARPWGVITDPRNEGRVLVAENNAPETSAPGRVVAVDLATHALEPLVILPSAADGLAFPRPRGIATQRKSARLLALCETDPLTGHVELRSVDLGRADTNSAISLGLVTGTSPAALAAGDQDDILISTSAPDRLVHVAGGVERHATITAVDATTAKATLATPFTLPFDPKSRWRVRITDDAPLRVTSSPGGESHEFLWDSSEVPGGGNTLLKATPMDANDIGTVFSSSGPKAISPLFAADSPALGTGTSPRASVMADLDGDGDVDLVVADATDNHLLVFWQTAPGTFDPTPLTLDAPGPVCVRAADLNGDGLLDLVSANPGGDNLTVFWQTALHTFNPDPTPLGDSTTTLGAAFVEAADLDGDGMLELVSANYGANDLTIFWQTSPGTFGPPTQVSGAFPPIGPVCVQVVDLDGDGMLDLVSANLGGGDLTVFLQTSPGTFESSQHLGDSSMTSGAASVRAADLDGDGDLDLVSANQGSNDLTIFWQTAPGTFDPNPTKVGENLTALNKPVCVQAADLDGDGDLDLVSANENSNDLTVFWQSAPGTFDAIPTVLDGQGITGPMDVQVADVDGDGDLDLVVANQGGHDLKLGRQTSPGTFNSAPMVVQGLPNVLDGSLAVQAADLDGDGHLDLVTANQLSNNLTVFWQTSPAAFDPMPTTVVGSSGPPTSVQAADLDGDGNLDLVTANQDSDNLTVFRQTDSHTFDVNPTTLVVPGTNPGPRFVLAADLDGDCKLDLVSANQGSGNLTLFWQTTPFGFDSSSPPLGDSSTTAGACFVQAADLNGDGMLDLVSANYDANDLTIFWHLAPLVFDSTPIAVGAVAGPVCVQAADLNGDGKLDLVSANQGSSNLTVFWQTTPGQFDPNPTPLGGPGMTDNPAFVQAADLDGDGDLDLVCANRDGNTLTVFWQTAPGIFDPNPTIISLSAGFAPTCIQAADIDEDGDLDLVTASYAHHALWVYRRLH